jgi:sugar lactone lactonase YvrE
MVDEPTRAASAALPENGPRLPPAPAAPGDIYAAATDVDDAHVDLRAHKGPGRILHYDEQFNLKGMLFTGLEGLVIGLALDAQNGVLYACDSQNRDISRFDVKTGAKLPKAAFIPARNFGSMMFISPREAVLGVHTFRGEDAANPSPKLYLADFAAETATPLVVEIDGGKFGFHAVTHIGLDPDGRTLYYVSEGGRRIMRYDLAARRQLSDFIVLEKDDPRGACGVEVAMDGRVLMATGAGCVLFAPDGTLLKTYDIPARKGWARIQWANAARSQFWINNFFDGIVQKRDLETGTILMEHDIGRKFSLCGLAEIPR